MIPSFVAIADPGTYAVRLGEWRTSGSCFRCGIRFDVAPVEHANTPTFFRPFALMLPEADADDRWEPR